MHKIKPQKSQGAGSSPSGPITAPVANKEPFYLAKSPAFAALQTSVKGLHEVADKIPVPGLKEGTKGLTFVLDAMQKTSQNTSDVDSLTKRIQELSEMLSQATSVLEGVASGGTQLSDRMQARIDRMSKAWTDSAQKVKDLGAKPYMKRLMAHDGDARAVADQVAAVTWAIRSFTVDSLIAIEYALDDTRNFVQQSSARIETKVDDILVGQQIMVMKQDLARGVLPHAVRAPYYCNDKLRQCYPGTRVDVLARLAEWAAHSGAAPVPDDSDPSKLLTARVFWINGPGSAGTGKTTIAYTMALILDAEHKLAASFFCSRDVLECSDPKLIFPTIAYQLGQFCPAFGREISALLTLSPDEAFSVVPRQVEKLLVEPLRAVKDQMPPCIVIIDALDECRDGGATSIILSSLAMHISELSPIKFLITSRPELHVMNAFKVAQLDKVTQRYILHHVEPQVVEADIYKFLNHKLQMIRETYSLDDRWPSMKDVEALTKMASGLFVFAVTAGLLIQEYDDPEGQMKKLLSNSQSDKPSYRELDQLYIQVLNAAFPGPSLELASRVRLILGSIVLLRDPLSVADLNNLLKVSAPIDTTLKRLQSVIIIPEQHSKPVQLLHPTFYEFLVTPGRCIEPFLIRVDRHHTLLAQSCLDVLSTLTKNICNLSDPWTLHEDLEDFATIIRKNIPSFLKYACYNWAYHMSQGLLSDTLLEKLDHFCQNHLLHWVETCSLLGDLHGTTVALKLAQSHLSVCHMALSYCNIC
ncbi:hypothetical protein HWV62_25810 [Athelia sp. TMB]|nr:hypothetical protein HWV62_25810 [Athelia sp. TMB]